MTSELGAVCRWLLSAWLLAVTALPANADPARTETTTAPTFNRTTGIHVVSDDNYPPYLFLSSEGQPTGYVADLWRLWENRTGIPVRLTATTWSEAQAMVQRGDADVIDLIFRTPAREPLYEFSAPHAEVPVAIFRHISVTGIHDTQTLHGFEVGVQEGDACIEALARAGITSVKAYRNYAALITAAQEQQVKVFCLDEYPANYYLYLRGLHQDYAKAFELYRGEFHWATVKGRSDLLQEVERGMSLITEAEREALREKWLGTPTDWRPALRFLGWSAGGLAVAAALLAAWILLLRTQVRRRTGELQQQRARLDAVLSAIPDLVWLKDTQGRYLGCNRRFEQLYGRGEPELLGHTDYDFVDRAQADSFRYHDQRALTTGEPVKNEEWLTFSVGGETRLFETVKTPLIGPDGHALGVLGVARDITDRQHAADALERQVDERTAELAQTARELREANAELDALFAAVPLGLVVVQHRRILKCNPGVERIFGYRADELIGQSTRIWYPDETVFRERGERLAAAMEQGKVDTVEVEMVHRDGHRFWVRIVTQALDPGNPARGVIATVEDITSEHEAAEALRQAKAMAEHAAQVKADFLSNMSHEVRTPLNAILGLAHLALESELTSRQREQLQQIEASGRQLLRIINNVLDLSDIESGRLVLEPRPFSLRDTLHRVMQGICEKARAKGLVCETDLPDTLPDALVGDERRLAQILELLGDNAVKFTQQGHIRLGVRLEAEDPEHVRLRFAVEDTGIGIGAAERERLGQVFQQGDSSSRRRYGGIGMGLAVGKRLLQIMGGEAGLESEPGRGSTFWFVVSFARGSEGETAPRSEPLPGVAAAHVPEDAAADPGALVALLAQLQQLLAAGDAAGLEVASTQRELLRAAMGPQYPAFTQALDCFDFDRAADLLRLCAQGHGLAP